jgi:F-type H+-transporting ATPase subunit b
MPRILTAAALLLSPGLLLAAEGEGGQSPMAGSFWQSLAAIIVFLILLAVLYKYAWGPILQGLQQREEKIRGDLEEAEKANAEAKRTLEEYQQKLTEARNETRQMIEKARDDAEKLHAKLKSDAEQEAATVRKRAADEIRSAKEEALEEIYARTAALATDVAGRILQRQVTDEDTQRLVDESLEEMAHRPN